jgi:hypothetical protein
LLNGNHQLSLIRYHALSLYIGLSVLRLSGWPSRAMKGVFRRLIGTSLFDKNYGTFQRVRASDYYGQAVSSRAMQRGRPAGTVGHQQDGFSLPPVA